MKNTMAERISWIDICRGIAIVLVLYGHALTNDTQRFLIYAFHMPLFFFLSGIVFKADKTKSLLSIVTKYAKQILVPYFIFAILTFIVGYILLQPQTYTMAGLQKQAYGLLFGNGNSGYLAHNVALWFLPCLFITKTAFAFLTRFVTNKKFIIALMVVISIAGYLFSLYYSPVKLFFGLETALTGSVFFAAGYIWNQSSNLKTYFTKRKVLIFGVALVALISFAALNFSLHGTQIDMRQNRMNNYFLFYLAAFGGIFMAIALSMIIKKNAILEYFGKHSLLLFVWHTMLFTVFTKYDIPPFHIAYLSPTFYLVQALLIILIGRIIVERIKAATVYKRSGINGKQ